MLSIRAASDEWVPTEEIRDEISVCVDCLVMSANGECDPDRPADLPEPLSAIGFGMSITMGGTHNEGCPNRDTDSASFEDCDCDDLGFSTYACEGCGDYHHGDRYRFTLWQTTIPAALKQHRCRMYDSRYYRTQNRHGDAASARDEAAAWRRFIADRKIERSD